MKPIDHMASVIALTRYSARLRAGAAAGILDDCEELSGTTLDANIVEHLRALDEAGWLDWIAGELENANLISSSFGVGALD